MKRMRAVMLATLVGLSVVCSGLGNWVNKAYAEENTSTPPDYAMDYDQLSLTELDRLTYRTEPSNKSPQITVFTHGAGGYAGNWSNDGANGYFDYESDSMIEELRQSIENNGGEALILKVSVKYDVKQFSGRLEENGGVIVRGKLKADAQSRLVSDENGNLDDEIIEQDGAASLRASYIDYMPIISPGSSSHDRELNIQLCEPNAYPVNDNKPYSLSHTDVAKHWIIVFEQDQDKTCESHDYVYSQFEYVLDCLSYRYRQLSGELPTYNMIAHSRGGITNMQYALAHPYNVRSMYSMGSPYNGSVFGSIEFGDYFFLGLGGYKPNYTYLDGSKDFAPGVLDITNKTLSDSYKNYWNAHCGDWYQHIEFKPIGSYATLSFVLEVVCELCNADDWVRELVEGVEIIDSAQILREPGGLGVLLVDMMENAVEAVRMRTI